MMPDSAFNLIEGSLYRSPLNLVEGDQSTHGHSWDLGYHHAKRGKEAEPNNPYVGDAEAYMDGYKTSKGEQGGGEQGGGDLQAPVPRGWENMGGGSSGSSGGFGDRFGALSIRHDIRLNVGERPKGPPTEHENQLIERIRSGQGIKPGEFRRLIRESGQDPVAVSDRLAPHFAAAGQRLIDGAQTTPTGERIIDDPAQQSLKRAWDMVVGPNPDLSMASTAARRLTRRLSTLGVEAIPPEEYQQRHDAFISAVEFKLKVGDRTGKKARRYGNISEADLDRTRRYASSFFQALGPVAEEGLGRIGNMFVMGRGSMRSFYAPDLNNFCFDDRGAFSHEFGHAVEDHLNSPNKKGVLGHSYWSARIEGRDSSPAKHLGLLLGRSGYDSHEVAKEDKWGHAYMGKVYKNSRDVSRGFSEVMSMFIEGVTTGDSARYWSKQIKKDPQAALEVAGFLHASMIGAQGMARSEASLEAPAVSTPGSPLGAGSNIRNFSQVFHPLYGRGEVTHASSDSDRVRVQFGKDEIQLTRGELKLLR